MCGSSGSVEESRKAVCLPLTSVVILTSFSPLCLSLLSSSIEILPFLLFCSIGGFVKTWLPFVLFLGVIVTIVLTLHLR